MVLPDPDSEDTRTRTGGMRLVVGGAIAAVILVAVMALLAGDPDPQQGESLPNAPPQGAEVTE